MKIVYVLNSTYLFGGATKSFMMLLEGIIFKGYTPIVIVPDKNGIFEKLIEMGCKVYVCTFRPCTYPYTRNWKDWLLFVPRLLARLMINRLAVDKIVNFLSDKNVDIIHTNVSVIDVGFDAAKKLGVPHIFHFREYADLDFGMKYFPTKKYFTERINKSWSYSICITKGIQNHHCLAGTNRSVVIYNGISKKQSELKPSVVSKEYFIYAGRIEFAKGLDMLLQAYVSYVKQSCEPYPLFVAGECIDTKYLTKLKLYIHDSGIEELVKFLGPCTNMDELMQKAVAVIIPSRFEAFGRCMPEAMFNGTLVIGNNTGGTKEQFDNGLKVVGHEIGFRYQTVDELAMHMVDIASHSIDSYNSMINDAFCVVNTLYTEESYVNSVFNLYKSIKAK